MISSARLVPSREHRTSAGTPLGCALAVVLLAITALAGCVSPPPLNVLAGTPITVRLPISQAGLVDARTAFAVSFDQELSREAGDAKPSAASPASARPRARDLLHLDPVPGEVALTTHAPVAEPRSPPARPLRLERTAVLIVPGAFGECIADQALPFMDQPPASRMILDGTAYAGMRAALGASVLWAIPVGGRADTQANALVIAAALRQQADDPSIESILMVGYSKGVADALEALATLERSGQRPTKVRALISVAGAVMGSPLAQRYARLYRSVGAMLPLRECRYHGGAELDSLTPERRSAEMAALPPMPGLSLYSVAAFTDHERVSRGLRHFHAVLSDNDARNDGQLLLPDALLPRSTLLAVVDADHWRFVLPLSKAHSVLLRGLASPEPFPREAFFRALVRHAAAWTPRQ